MECRTCGNSLVDGRCLACAARTAPPVSIGEVLDGRWHVEARIAEGGMGAVYRAREPALDRQVAIKFLTPGRVSHRAAVERFLAEARQTAALRHPNIVAIHAVGERHGTPFMVMEHLDGEPLDRRIARGPLPPAEVLGIVRQVISALELLRSKGLVHRDIKPGNIVVDARSHATLLDFGLSRKQVRDEGGLTAAGVVVGTPGYLAPERALGTAEIDHRSDLFSVGLVTFELLTGRRAITAEHPAALLGKQLTAPVLDPRAVRPDLPPALEGFFARACAQAPAARFQDGAAFLAGLEAALGAQPSAAGPGARRWWPIAVGASAAAFLAVAIVLWPTKPDPLPTPPTPLPVAAPVELSPPSAPTSPPTESPAEDSVRSLSMPPVPVVFADPRKRPPVSLRPRLPEPAPTKPAEPPPGKETGAPAKITVLTRSASGARWANVYVDGQPRGSTPARLEVTPGRHVVLVERDGVRSAPREVTGVAGSVATVIFELGE